MQAFINAFEQEIPDATVGMAFEAWLDFDSKNIPTQIYLQMYKKNDRIW